MWLPTKDVNNDLIISIRNNCPISSMMQHTMILNNENEAGIVQLMIVPLNTFCTWKHLKSFQSINQWWLKHLLYSFHYEHSYDLLNVNIHVYIAKLIHRNRIPTFEFIVCVHNNRFIKRVSARFALHEITFLHTIYYGHLQRIYLWWLV